MVFGVLAWAFASPPEWEVDAAAWRGGQGAVPLQPALDGACATQPDGPLALAAVIYAKAGGLSTWGHASLRVLGCAAGRGTDREYETYRFSRNDWEILGDYLPGASFLQDRPYLRSLRGQLLLYRNEPTLDRGFYAQSLATNREIYELWLDLSPADLGRVAAGLEQAWRDQQATFDERRPLDLRYQPLGTNCTWPARALAGLHEGTESFAGLVFPFVALRALEPRVGRRVVYVGEDRLRRLAGELGVSALADRLEAGSLTDKRRNTPWRLPLPARWRAELEAAARRQQPVVARWLSEGGWPASQETP